MVDSGRGYIQNKRINFFHEQLDVVLNCEPSTLQANTEQSEFKAWLCYVMRQSIRNKFKRLLHNKITRANNHLYIIENC